eukprot:GCRY01004437.1.p1 GENE.GCRY01004437.1~~GCRY01004437.1.p1  ORF type:complete len:326 (+),score=49.07 GCRY01004437.1:142-1119(+)
MVHCDEDAVEWIKTALGECASNSLQIASVFFGLASIGIWMFAQFPQIFMNFKRGSVESLSLPFIAEWLLGDLTNFVGALLTHQLPTQIFTGGYFVCVDIIVCFQFIVFSIRDRVRGKNKQYSNINSEDSAGGDEIARTSSSSNMANKSSVAILGVVLLLSLYFTLPGLSIDSAAHSSVSSRHLLSKGSDTSATLGVILGWVSTTLYVTSRTPQIWKNFRRKTVDGLSFLMFFCAVGGNGFYGISIFLYSTDSSFLMDKLPWLVGSLGTVCFDFMIFCQFYLYRKNTAQDGETTPFAKEGEAGSSSNKAYTLVYGDDCSENEAERV